MDWGRPGILQSKARQHDGHLQTGPGVAARRDTAAAAGSLQTRLTTCTCTCKLRMPHIFKQPCSPVGGPGVKRSKEAQGCCLTPPLQQLSVPDNRASLVDLQTCCVTFCCCSCGGVRDGTKGSMAAAAAAEQECVNT